MPNDTYGSESSTRVQMSYDPATGSWVRTTYTDTNTTDVPVASASTEEDNTAPSVTNVTNSKGQSPAEQVITVTRSEIGYLAKRTEEMLDDKTANAGNNDYTKYARDLDALGTYRVPVQGFDWCATFVDWCFYKAFGLDTMLKMTYQPLGGYGAGADASAGYFRTVGKLYDSGPQIGDQIFFYGGSGIGHTGIVVGFDSTKVYTVEGNTSASVAEREYNITSPNIAGYGRPDWSLAPYLSTSGDSQTQSQAEANTQMALALLHTLSGELSVKASARLFKIRVNNTVNLNGFGRFLSGLYYVTSVKRNLSSDSGYSTSIGVLKTGFSKGIKAYNDSVYTSPEDTSPVNDSRPEEVVAVAPAFKVGDKVVIFAENAVYKSGVRVPNWIKQKPSHTIRQISTDGVFILLREINSWVYACDIKFAD